MQILADHRVRQPEHQGNVGIRTRRQPLGVHVVGRIVAQRRDTDDFDTRVGDTAQPSLGGMLAGAARFDLGVFRPDAAECDEELGVVGDIAP